MSRRFSLKKLFSIDGYDEDKIYDEDSIAHISKGDGKACKWQNCSFL